MKAMILAAGLGTRLRPLTDTRPKALVEIAGRTLLEITLSRLRSLGVSEVIINVHHFSAMVTDYLKANKNFGMRIEISREDVLLDTGGGLKKAAWFFLEHSHRTAKKKRSDVIPSAARNRDKMSAESNTDNTPGASSILDEPFILHNVDVISTIDLQRMLQFHTENRALATLAVQSRESSRLLLFDDRLQLRARAGSTAIPDCAPANSRRQGTASQRAENKPSDVIPSKARNPGGTLTQPNSDQTRSTSASAVLLPLAFSGIHVISPRLLPLLTEEGIFSIIDSYLRLASQGQKILAFRADEYYWRDLGRLSDLSQAALDLKQKALL